MAQHDVDAAVVVAGLGPVGGLLAALLGGCGVRTVVIEPNDRPYPAPRAAILDVEAIRVLATLPGMPPLARWSTPLARNGVLDPAGRPLIEVEHHATAFGLPQVVRIDQPAMEAGLAAAVAHTGNVDVRNGRRVHAVEQDADVVTVILDDASRVRAHWLVGCDGAGSTVRQAAGISFPGTTYPQPWLVVDADVRDRVPAEHEGASVAFVLDPARPAVVMTQPGRRRWEWMLLPGEDTAEATRPERLRPLIAPWTDPGTLDVRRAAVFTFHARSAGRWRAGRVLLAGDAAHTMPPFAGAGLGMGIRDAVTLAWRLADVVHGRSGPELLDAYERERRPDVERMTTTALRVGRIVQNRHRVLSGLTRLVIRAIGAVPGLVARLGDRPMPPRRLPRRLAGPLRRAGQVLPNPRVSVDGGPPVRLDEVIGYRWAYLGYGCDPRTVAEVDHRDAAVLTVGGTATPGCPAITDLDGLLTGAPGTVTAVRPDRFLHGVLS